MDKIKPIKIGIIGCGNISQAYFNGAKIFEILEIAACADLNFEKAQAQAKENHCQAKTVEALLADPDIELVVNLTIPAAHADVSKQILHSGKHVYSEKPLAVNLEQGREIIQLAHSQNLLIGCAPDTFLGAGQQTARKVIDDGWLGSIKSGTAFMMTSGPESWHPNPHFFYQKGAGPMFDMGPYYITALVNLLGPVKSVSAMTSRALDTRIATCQEAFGERIQVEIPTHYSGILKFHNGATISITLSFDVVSHSHPSIELYGLEGSIKVPDPNTFGGPVELTTRTSGSWQPQTMAHGYDTNTRSIGVADMAYSIRSSSSRPYRCNGELALHTLEVMSAFEESSIKGSVIPIKSKPIQPSPLPLGILKGRLDP